MFRVLFAVAVGDCYLNGPCVREEEKYLAVLLSVVALASNAQWAFLLAELAWFVVFARTGFGDKPVSVVAVVPAASAASASPKEASIAAMPTELQKLVDASVTEFDKQRVGSDTSDGGRWETFSSQGGITISKAPFPGQSFYKWRVESTLYGKFDDVVAEMFDFAKRAGPQGWDSKLAKGAVHKEYASGYRITCYSTNPLIGGAVSGREFVEARRVQIDEDKLTYLAAGVGLEEKLWKSKLGADFPPADKSLTKAMTYSGSGFYMSPAQPGLGGREVPQYWNYQLINCTAIGGWIPVSTINNATGPTLIDVTKDTQAHFLKKFKN